MPSLSRHTARNYSGRNKVGRLTQANHQGRSARCDEWRASRHRCRGCDVLHCQLTALTPCSDVVCGSFFGYGRSVYDKRHFRCPRPAYAQTLRHRPSNGIKHFSDHGYRCRKHGLAARTSYDTDELNPDFPLAFYCGRSIGRICMKKIKKYSVNVE